MCPEEAAIWRAAGRTVVLPERYADGIPSSEASAAALASDRAPCRGNSIDVGALLAAVVGLLGLASCCGATYVIPLIAFSLGLVGWLQAKDAVYPRRTRWLSGVGMASGGIFLLGVLLMFSLCLVFFVVSLAIPSTRTVTFPTPTPSFFPTPTP